MEMQNREKQRNQIEPLLTTAETEKRKGDRFNRSTRNGIPRETTHKKSIFFEREVTLMKQIRAIISKDMLLWKRNTFNFWLMFGLALGFGKTKNHHNVPFLVKNRIFLIWLKNLRLKIPA